MNGKEIITQLIKEYGGTQKRFASVVGVSQPAVASWMNMEHLTSGVIGKLMKMDPNLNMEFLSGNSTAMFRNTQGGGTETPVGAPYFVNLPASAGQLPMFDEDHTSEFISIPGTNAEAYFPVKGCSMEPTLQSGDIIGIRTMQSLDSLRPNEIYLVFTTDNERMIKRIKETNDETWLTLHSDNPEYKPFRVLKSQISAIYRVVCLIRSLE